MTPNFQQPVAGLLLGWNAQGQLLQVFDTPDTQGTKHEIERSRSGTRAYVHCVEVWREIADHRERAAEFHRLIAEHEPLNQRYPKQRK